MRLLSIIIAVLLQLCLTSALKIGTSKSTTQDPNNSTLTSTTTIATTISTMNFETSTLRTTTVASISSKAPSSGVPTNVPAVLTTPMSFLAPLDEHKMKGISQNEFCHCNLNLNVCDLNCCCDGDCPENMLKVFDCNSNHKINKLHLDDKQTNIAYGLPSCDTNDGWLCVFRNNHKPQTTDKVIDLISDTTNMYKWPELLESQDQGKINHKMHDYYKLNEPLQLVNIKTRQIKHIELPFAFMTANCNLKIPLTHLKPRKYACPYRNADELLSNKEELINLLAETKVLHTPISPELILSSKDDDLAPYLGDLSMQNCFNDIEEQAAHCSPLTGSDNVTESQKEQVHATEIIFEIYHNFTSILNVVVVFAENELLDTDNEQNCGIIWQNYDVRFITKMPKDEKLNSGKSVKNGPVGYLQGEPVIVTRLEASNTSSSQALIDDFNGKNSRLKNSLSLFTRRQNNCHQDDTKLISFGINEQKECFVALKNETQVFSSDTNQMNYTRVCYALQRLAWTQLFNLPNLDNSHSLWLHLNNLQVSKLGRPNNQTDKWLPLHVKNFEEAPILVSSDSKTQSFTCHNILLSASYEFHFVHSVRNNIPGQGVIKQATLVMGRLHDLEFAIDEQIEVPLTISVMFYDIMLRNSVSSAKNNYYWQLLMLITANICLNTVSIGFLNL